LHILEPPPDGIWRVGRGPDPLAVRPPLGPDELDQPKTGNRFDSPMGTYTVRYFSTTLAGCFGETLARFRPELDRLAEVAEEWRELGFMPLGELPADWRNRRLAVRVQVEHRRSPNPTRFLDVEHIDTRERLRVELAQTLSLLGVGDLDVATVRGGDRRITRAISWWAHQHRDKEGHSVFAGVRYLSRLNNEWEC
jgi:RES domain